MRGGKEVVPDKGEMVVNKESRALELDLQKRKRQWSQGTGRKSRVLQEERLQWVPTSILFWNVQLVLFSVFHHNANTEQAAVVIL